MKALDMVNRIVGFLIPLPVFVDPTSPILLANSYLSEAGLAVPLSFLFLPVALFSMTVVSKQIKVISGAGVYVITYIFLIVWFFGVAAASALDNTSSLLYALQWSIWPLWGLYFLLCVPVSDYRGLKGLSRGFVVGAILGSLYIFSSGVFEVLIYGALMDSGRITQNLILPGQYQMYVYVPTTLAYSFLIVFALKKASLVQIDNRIMIFYFLITACSLLFLAAREGLLVFILGLLFFLRGKKAFGIAAVGVIFVFSFLLVVSPDSREVNLDPDSEARIIRKIANLDDSRSAGRGDIAKQYLEVIAERPVFGTLMLPPKVALPHMNVFAPSAHNYYIDIYAWAGFPAFILLLIFVFTFLSQGLKLWQSNNANKSRFLGFFVIGMMFIFISNLINVPLRSPLTAPIITYLVVVILSINRRVTSSK